jgi:hypothetical protein
MLVGLGNEVSAALVRQHCKEIWVHVGAYLSCQRTGADAVATRSVPLWDSAKPSGWSWFGTATTPAPAQATSAGDHEPVGADSERSERECTDLTDHWSIRGPHDWSIVRNSPFRQSRKAGVHATGW